MQMPVSSYRDLIIRPLLQPLMSRLFGLVKSARYLYTLSRMAEDTAVADLQAALNTFSRDASEGLQMLASLVLASDDGRHHKHIMAPSSQLSCVTVFETFAKSFGAKGF